MAITARTPSITKFGDYYMTRNLIDFDSSYPAGGETVTTANLGFSDHVSDLIVWAIPKSGYSFEWDSANGKLKALTAIKTYTAALNPASLATDAANATAVTVTGVAATDICLACHPVATFEGGMVVQSARVTGANEITVECTNASAGTVDAAAGTATFYVAKANGAAQEVPDTTDLSAVTAVEVYALGRNPA